MLTRWTRKRVSRAVLGTSVILISGCATTVVTPEMASLPEMAAFRLTGKVAYEGNREYLPRVITEDSTGASTVTFEYRHETTYGSKYVPDAAALLNPLTGLGFPTGEQKLTVEGLLQILTESGEVLRAYRATSIVAQTQSLYSGETLTALRRRGLIAVRDNIDAQLYRDRELLNRLLVTK